MSVQLYLSAATLIIQTPANASQLTGFSATQALIERYSEQIIILFTIKKYKKEVDMGLLKHTRQIFLLQKATTGINK